MFIEKPGKIQDRMFHKEIIPTSAPGATFKSKAKVWNMSFKGTMLKHAFVFLCFSHW